MMTLDYFIGMMGTWFWVMLGIISVWELFWKGCGLWYSARNKEKTWFVCILIFNTAGILPIIYIILNKNKKKNKNRKRRRI